MAFDTYFYLLFSFTIIHWNHSINWILKENISACLVNAIYDFHLSRFNDKPTYIKIKSGLNYLLVFCFWKIQTKKNPVSGI